MGAVQLLKTMALLAARARGASSAAVAVRAVVKRMVAALKEFKVIFVEYFSSVCKQIVNWKRDEMSLDEYSPYI